MVSIEASSGFTILLARDKHPQGIQYLFGHASIQLTLDRYSHWMPTMDKHTASAMDEALDETDCEGVPQMTRKAHSKGKASSGSRWLAVLLIEPKLAAAMRCGQATEALPYTKISKV